jgi:hypothetical protein
MHERMLRDALGWLGVGLRTSKLLCGSYVRDRGHGVQHRLAVLFRIHLRDSIEHMRGDVYQQRGLC